MSYADGEEENDCYEGGGSQGIERGGEGGVDIPQCAEVERAHEYLLMGEVGAEAAGGQPVDRAAVEAEAAEVEHQAGGTGDAEGIGVGSEDGG